MHKIQLPFKYKKCTKMNKFARFRSVNNVRNCKKTVNTDLVIVEGCLEGGRKLKILVDTGSQAELISKETAVLNYGNLFYTHDSYFKESINQKVLLQMAMNIGNFIGREYVMEEIVQEGIKAAKASKVMEFIQLKHFIGGFILYAVGIVLACAAFVGEVAKKKSSYPK